MSNPNKKINQEYTQQEQLYKEAYNRAYEEAMACFTGMALAGLIEDIYPGAYDYPEEEQLNACTGHVWPHEED